MRLKNGNYCFIVSHTKKNKAFVRRIEVSRRALHTFAGSAAILIFGAVAAFTFLGASGLQATTSGALSANSLQQDPTLSQAGVSYVDYSRPESALDFAQNSGGPFDGSFQLTATDTAAEEKDIEKRLQLIETTSNPKFLPTIWAHLGKINNEFGFRRNPFGGRSYEFHAGMDIDGDRGDIIVAPAHGIIAEAGWKGGYGYMIEIDHGNGLKTRYGHLSKLEVKEGEPIERGQLIGFVGSTGRSTGPHLHYELRLDEKPINPRRFLPPEPTEIRS
ncbi:MAG: M23 family peptidase [Acidobacteria bacterium]|nr:MAG: M23 family peptidase [Acidobacteriota bacterium]REK02083.1 MAG: M23 family peptidase [Acidobacteriota bacterium]REK15041.1 MAG: M23 family peptidase [Acidobacteriota bacterium]REK45755.1 MAG: M23 family peptidase [Acidobacteriota bacterium]